MKYSLIWSILKQDFKLGECHDKNDKTFLRRPIIVRCDWH
jgi:hypothetical protein